MASALPPPRPEEFRGWQSDQDQSNSTGPSGVTLFGIIMCSLLIVVIFFGSAWVISWIQRRYRRRENQTAPAENQNGDLSVGSHQQQRQKYEIPQLRELVVASQLNQQQNEIPRASSLLHQRQNERVSTTVATTETIFSPRLQKKFTYKELKEATDNFAERNLLGEGGFGKVYKGYLSADRKPVAIKKLKPGSQQGENEFLAEIEIISGIHHRNLVHLVGYSVSGPQRLLVYEFIPNKSLEYHLHEGDKSALNWQNRFNIARGTANGLAYLHENCNPKIIHRDIKSANILLDDSFQAKVADFGLAKLFPDDQTHVNTRVKGTHGYIDLDYVHTERLTEKSDVYSYGILLLEMITGCQPLQKLHSADDDNLAVQAKSLLSKAVKSGKFDFVDPKLEQYNKKEMTRMVACAAACVCQRASRRPQMSQIYQALTDCRT